ncbi:MAG: hypothetical protein WDM85_17775 [Caulobacteraceae bacterium]
MWTRGPGAIFLIVGGVTGVFVSAPIVAGFLTAWWWIAAPAGLAWAVVLWRWGLAWLSSDDDVAAASVWERAIGVAILLAYSFVGIVLAVYLAGLALQYWALIVVSLLALVLIALATWVSMLADKRNKAKSNPDNIVS